MKVDAMAINTIMRSPSSGTAILAAAMLFAGDQFCFSARWPNSKSRQSGTSEELGQFG